MSEVDLSVPPPATSTRKGYSPEVAKARRPEDQPPVDFGATSFGRRVEVSVECSLKRSASFDLTQAPRLPAGRRPLLEP